MGQVVTSNTLTEAEIEFIKANTKYDEKDIRKWWGNFQKDCPDGKMTTDQMTEMCRMVFPDLNMDELGEHTARVFDTDQDGCIDFTEFLVGMDATTEGSDKANVQNVFRMFDVDGNKVIDLKEMIEIMKASVNAVFYPGYEHDQEAIENDAKDLFNKMDTNKDGVVTKEEFVEIVGKQTE